MALSTWRRRTEEGKCFSFFTAWWHRARIRPSPSGPRRIYESGTERRVKVSGRRGEFRGQRYSQDGYRDGERWFWRLDTSHREAGTSFPCPKKVDILLGRNESRKRKNELRTHKNVGSALLCWLNESSEDVWAETGHSDTQRRTRSLSFPFFFLWALYLTCVSV